MSIRPNEAEDAYLKAKDINASTLWHEIMNAIMAADKHATPDDLVRDYAEREALKRAAFTAGLQHIFKAQVVNGVVQSKREIAVTGVLRDMDRRLGSPPWDAVEFRQRLKLVSKDDLKDCGINPDDLEAYARVRMLIKDSEYDHQPYLPSPPPEPPTPSNTPQTRKAARDTLYRQVGYLIKSTSDDGLADLKNKLSEKGDINRLCGKADVTFNDLWDELTAPNPGGED